MEVNQKLQNSYDSVINDPERQKHKPPEEKTREMACGVHVKNKQIGSHTARCEDCKEASRMKKQAKENVIAERKLAREDRDAADAAVEG